ncbi:hypothetical protein GCM10022377_05990 [Zhihengliuella alba]|uniref:ABC transporter domain-containing protein n=1 Tax=Zhihengliuella alba TaxID=547018 RepID=A0ABP7CYS6_9MICC
MSRPAPAPLLEARIRSFRFGGHGPEILRGVHLAVAPGSLTAVVGASGSGKTTLGRVLGGMLPAPSLHGAPAGADPDDDVLDAEFLVAGRRLAFSAGQRVRIDPAGWARYIGVLPQEAGHFLSGARQTVAEEIAFALENQGVPRARMRERVGEAAAGLGIEHLLEREVERLSGGQERIVALAALAVTDPEVLVLDEPFAGLDAGARDRVAEWIAQRCAAGRAVIHLARRSDGLPARADDVRELAGGRLVRAALPAVTERQSPPSRPAGPAAAAGPRRSRPLLELADAGIGYRVREASSRRLRPRWSAQALQTGVDLALRPGETVALLGPNGAGKTTLLKTAAGLLPPLSGTVRSTGRVGLLLQRSGDQLFERTVSREVGFGLEDSQGVARILDEVGLADAADSHPYELSGAARRLVALATVLVREPDVLLCDEPTVALDDAGIGLLRRLLARRTEAGRAVLFSTHDESFAAAAADRVVRLPDPSGEGDGCGDGTHGVHGAGAARWGRTAHAPDGPGRGTQT